MNEPDVGAACGNRSRGRPAASRFVRRPLETFSAVCRRPAMRAAACIVSAWSCLILLIVAGKLPAGFAAEPAADAVSPGATGESPAARAAETSPATVGPKPKPVPPRDAAAIDRSIRQGVEFLLARQNKDGSWGSARSARAMEVLAPVPGAHHAFHAAVTSLCVSALIEAGGPSPEVASAIDRGEAWLVEHLPRVRRATPEVFYNTWTHAYSIQALVRLYRRHEGDPGRQARLKELIAEQIDLLDRYEVVDGGWAYYDFKAHTKKPSGSSIGFVTATVLIALKEAEQIGCHVPPRLVERGMASIRRQRKVDFTYCYGEYLKLQPMHPVNRPGGSLGRSQVCNLAMRLWGDAEVTDQIVDAWLDRLFARNLWLDMGRKRPIPHESWFAVAGYFFYYGHYYAAMCIELLPPGARGRHYDQLADVLLPLQEKDGSWWDFPLYDYHQQYGTAFALMALERCRPH